MTHLLEKLSWCGLMTFSGHRISTSLRHFTFGRALWLTGSGLTTTIGSNAGVTFTARTFSTYRPLTHRLIAIRSSGSHTSSFTELTLLASSPWHRRLFLRSTTNLFRSFEISSITPTAAPFTDISRSFVSRNSDSCGSTATEGKKQATSPTPIDLCRHQSNQNQSSDTSSTTTTTTRTTVLVPSSKNDGDGSKNDETNQQTKFQPQREKGFENIATIPNVLTLSRIISAPFISYFIVTQQFSPALTLFVLAAVTDVCDGQIARRFPSQSSHIGSIVDPLADKLLIGPLIVSLYYINLLPLPLTLLIVSRDLLLVAAAMTVRYRSMPLPRTIVDYFNPAYVTTTFQPMFLSKVNTGVQLVCLFLSLAAPVFDFTGHLYLKIVWYATGATTILSGMAYLVNGSKTHRNLSKRVP